MKLDSSVRWNDKNGVGVIFVLDRRTLSARTLFTLLREGGAVRMSPFECGERTHHLVKTTVGAPVRCRSTPPSSRKRKLAEGFLLLGNAIPFHSPPPCGEGRGWGRLSEKE